MFWSAVLLGGQKCGCENFMDAWKNASVLQEKPFFSIKFLVCFLGGGILGFFFGGGGYFGFWGGGSADFIFMGARGFF